MLVSIEETDESAASVMEMDAEGRCVRTFHVRRFKVSAPCLVGPGRRLTERLGPPLDDREWRIFETILQPWMRSFDRGLPGGTFLLWLSRSVDLDALFASCSEESIARHQIWSNLMLAAEEMGFWLGVELAPDAALWTVAGRLVQGRY
ncbi:hypothetical protein EON82_03340 [bacterium]|nr:MAG: hypothetical protein EON82_03340 [bacterium]